MATAHKPPPLCVVGLIVCERRLGLHRLPVVNMENNIINVLTQSDLLAFMAQNMHLIGAIARKTLDECNIGRIPPQMARANEQTSVVVKRLHDKRISGLPVVDEDGKIIANFSISDLKVRHMRYSVCQSSQSCVCVS
jgi:CBS-domain-containing membrane protein